MGVGSESNNKLTNMCKIITLNGFMKENMWVNNRGGWPSLQGSGPASLNKECWSTDLKD